MKSLEWAILSPQKHQPKGQVMDAHLRRTIKRTRRERMDKQIETDDASLILPFRAMGAVFEAAAHFRRTVVGFLSGDPQRAESICKGIYKFMEACDSIVGQDLEEWGYMFALGQGVKGADALEEIGGRISALEWCKAEIRGDTLYLWSSDEEPPDDDDEDEEEK